MFAVCEGIKTWCISFFYLSRAQDFGTAMARHDPQFARPDKQKVLDKLYIGVGSTAKTGRVDFVDFAIMRLRKKL